jgi:hypothetical protein
MAVTKKVLATKTSQLKVLLTDAEKRKVAEALAQAEGELRDHTAKAKDIGAELKAKKEQIDNALRVLGQTARNGYEYRPVAVRVEADFRQGRVYEIREDTGEVVGERPLTEQDRQGSIFDAPPVDELRREAGKAVARMNEAAEDLEKARAAREAKKGEPPALKWDREGENLAARTAAGAYCIEPNFKGDGFTLLWTPAGGKSRALEFDIRTEAAAKEAARRHQLEGGADAILENAGDGKLTKKRRGKKSEARP